MPGRKRKRVRENASQVPLLPPEIHEDDIEISDEDIEFVTQNKRFAGFLTGLDTKSITKQVLGLKPDWKGDSLEKFYEKKTASKSKDSDNAITVDPVDALPVKGLDGKLEYRRAQKTQAQPSNKLRSNENDKEEPNESIKREVEVGDKIAKGKKEKKRKSRESRADEDKPGIVSGLQPKVLEELEEFVSVEEKRNRMKEKIAQLSTGLLSSPEESTGPLKELLTLCLEKDETIQHLAMISLMAIFKDILPGYRIRPPTEKELEMKVSKEVKKTRDYESALLKCYQGYLQMLMKTSKLVSGRHVALKSMCGLLEAVPHFNFVESLLRAVIPFLNASEPLERSLASAALRSLFKNEAKHGGEATVEAVQLIADYVKENDCNLQPDVLQVFLGLTFNEDIINESSKDKKDQKSKLKSKREEKKGKKNPSTDDIRKEVEEDFREASTLPDADHIRKLQTATLSAVFETYFRVLKAAVTSTTVPGGSGNSHPLLGSCLQGLLKFSHLISIDFLGDLLTVLRKLADGRSALEERLQCCVAAFKVMKANMDALTVDLKEFYVHFYDVLLQLYPDRNQDSENSFAEALQVILLESRQHDMERVAALSKRLASISFHFGSCTAMAALVTIRHLLLRHKKCRNLLENDGGGGNAMVFRSEETDPDLSGALSSVMWELALMRKHFNPDVANLSQQISNILATENFSAVMSPLDATRAYSTQQGGFRPAVKLPSKIAKKRSYKFQASIDSNREEDEDEEAVSFKNYFRLLRDISENQVLRKELLRSKTMLERYERYRKENPTTKKRKSRVSEAKFGRTAKTASKIADDFC